MCLEQNSFSSLLELKAAKNIRTLDLNLIDAYCQVNIQFVKQFLRQTTKKIRNRIELSCSLLNHMVWTLVHC